MQKNYLFVFTLFLGAFVTFSSCNKVSSRQDLEKIQELESKVELSRTDIYMADTSLLGELGRSYISFADKYPDAPETPELLFRAGELYSNDLGNMSHSLEAFRRNYQNYPQHETAANALFLIGYLNHNVLQNLVQAEKHYKEFLEKYPEHKMAQTAEFELQFLGKSAEEVFNEFILPKDTSKVDSGS